MNERETVRPWEPERYRQQRTVEHKVWLADCTVWIRLPSDLTAAEARRVALFVLSQAIDSAFDPVDIEYYIGKPEAKE